MNIDAKTALIIVDSDVSPTRAVSSRMIVAQRNIAALVATWQSHKLPIVHVACDPLRGGPDESNSNVIVTKDQSEPKRRQGSRAPLHENLKIRRIRKVVISGLANDGCTSTITRITADLGLESYVVSDTSDETGDASEPCSSHAAPAESLRMHITKPTSVGTVDALVAVSTSMFIGP